LGRKSTDARFPAPAAGGVGVVECVVYLTTIWGDRVVAAAGRLVCQRVETGWSAAAVQHTFGVAAPSILAAPTGLVGPVAYAAFGVEENFDL
jgi:hypothetical protein